MDVTITIPDKHLKKVAEAYEPWGFIPLEKGNNAEKAAHLAEWLGERWESELRQIITDKVRQDAVKAVEEAQADEDPLAP